MDRRTLVTAALALLAVLALGVAAATLDSATTTTASGGLGAGTSPNDAGLGEDSDGALDLGGERPSGEARLRVSVCVEFLTRPGVQLGLLGGVGVFLGAMYRTTRSWLISGLFVAAALFPLGVLYLGLISCGSSPTEVAVGAAESAVENASLLPSGGGAAGANAAGEAVSAPTALVGLLLVVAILGSVLLLVVSTGDDEDDLAEAPPEPPAPERRREVGARAGEAADRLESDADLENEVYRAWREMTGALAVENPRSTTPAEFAAAAVDAGMAREDVSTLTEAFEAVRYGDEPATPEREREAVAALRRIEEAYAGDAADAAAAGSNDASAADRTGGRDSGGDAR
ncbi:DUF4129 domain-containing protein [Halobaculum gomorrense]|uniref:Protein-glutamine gamma-glutamyltransferase-like C-terminal domain-containing protein n=1 Tax=Halobaculum gomorrense TaxID=43928 RepID=A0A1M5JP45_9EURY|nr:DUF4129 domain-containing protein [Halobaculum gomorrense]SHG41753.1 protein of unknown function [Halobaculum gomorrense]